MVEKGFPVWATRVANRKENRQERQVAIPRAIRKRRNRRSSRKSNMAVVKSGYCPWLILSLLFTAQVDFLYSVS